MIRRPKAPSMLPMFSISDTPYVSLFVCHKFFFIQSIGRFVLTISTSDRSDILIMPPSTICIAYVQNRLLDSSTNTTGA